MTQQSPRLDYIDSVRGLAVILAMLSHSLLQFFPEFLALKPVTRTATPAFVILFGVMLEIAYLRKLRAGTDGTNVEMRLISRMLTCYLFFAAISLAAYVTGKLSRMETFKALLFIDDGYLGVILKIYAVLFLIVLLFLPLVRAFGARFFLAAALTGWCLKYLLDAALPESPYFVAFVFGNSEGFGPSILPSMTFLAFGSAFGEYLTGQRGPTLAVAMLVLAIGVIGYPLWQIDPLTLMRDVWPVSRWTNDPFYYAMGICSTSLFLTAFWLTWRRTRVDSVSRFTATMGRQTLFIYGAGNVFLAMLPSYSGENATLATTLALVFMTLLLAIAWVRARRPTWLDRALLGVPSRYARAYESFIEFWTSIVHGTLRVALGRGK